MRTSEWVSTGHPDKIADSISEYILDRYLEKDSNVRYALECQIKGIYVSLVGEITSTYTVSDIQYLKWVREAINLIGYTKDYQTKWGEESTICADDIQVITHISQQSPNISQGVDNLGAGDQGIYVGYAENNKDTNYMPVDFYYARELGKSLYDMALKPLSIIGLDIKTQVTLDEIDNIIDVVVAVPMIYDCVNEIKEHTIMFFRQFNQNITEDMITVNGTGIYKIHGPIADSGTTGRKLVVDSYGGNSPIGGGALVTKDSTKTDLLLNLYARQLAINYLKKFENAFYATASLSGCIGKNVINVTLRAYDKHRYPMIPTEYVEQISIRDLANEYELRTPIFFEVNKKGFYGNNYNWEK